MATVFDHSKESFLEALGFDSNDVHSINVKLADISKHMIMTTCKQSELCEKIASTLSYNELLFVATLYVTQKTADIVEENPLLVKMMHLKSMIEDLESEQE